MVTEQSLRKIKAVALDIDGVLTDGSLVLLSDGDLLRVMNAKDSFAIRAAVRKGLIVAVISGGQTEALRIRCLNLNIRPENIFLGARGKLSIFRRFCEQNALSPDEVMYFGDDIPDVQVLRECGIGVAPADAVPEAKEAADIVSEYPGGGCCVRHGIEDLLKAQGKWVFDPDKFEQFY